jgi:O-antigen/teichoic acid export membrane protein
MITDVRGTSSQISVDEQAKVEEEVSSGSTRQDRRNSSLVGHAFAQLAANSGAGFLSRIGIYIPNFAVISYITASLGPQRYGTWALVMAIVGYANVLDMGLAFGLTRYFARSYEKKEYRQMESVLAASLILYSVFGVGVAAAGWLFRDAILSHFRFPAHFQADARLAFMLALWFFAVTNLSSVFQSVLLAIQRADLVSGVNVLTSVATAVAMAIAVYVGGSASAIVAGQLIASVIAAVWTYAILRSKVPEVRLIFRDIQWRETGGAISFGAKVMMTRLASRVNFAIDTLLLGAMVGALSVSYMDLGMRVGSLLVSLSWMLSMPVMPMIAALQITASEQERRELVERIDRTFYPVLFFLAGGMFVSADALVLAWLGPPYRQVGLVIRVLAIALLGLTMTYPFMQNLRGLGQMKIEISVSAGRLFGHLILSWLFIRLWGLTGALISIAVVLTGSGLIFNFLALRAVLGKGAGGLARRLALLTGGTALAVGAGQLIEKAMISLFGSSRPAMAVTVVICGAVFTIVYGYVLFLTKQVQVSDLRKFVAFRRGSASVICGES